MEYVRIAILNNDNKVVGYLDNSLPDALHYYDDTLHMYLQGTASTFGFTTSTNGNEWFAKLKVGNKLAFRYDSRDYFFTIMQTEQTEDELTVTAMGSCFELINEECTAYPPDGTDAKAMTFEEYLALFDPAGVLTIGKNQIDDYTRTLTWDGEESQLARIYSLATEFDAEVEFRPVLNDDYTLKEMRINVYHEHDDENQGIGSDRANSARLRYGYGLEGITKSSDTTELYTSILATGEDGLTIYGYTPTGSDWTQTDDNGNVLYSKPLNSAYMQADAAIAKFPSQTTGDGDKAILYRWDTDYTTKEKLFSKALAKLKKISKPQVTYEIDSTYSDQVSYRIGDTVTVIDEEFEPSLYLEARITEQEISFTDPTKNKTTYSNIDVLKAGVISAAVQEQIAQAKSLATTAKASADTATAKASEAQTAAETAQATATTASTTASEAKSAAESASTTATAASTAASEAKTTAANAQTTANTAKSTAETAQSTADTASTTASEAKSAAESAQTTAETAQSTADTAKSTAETAQSTAETAQTTANTAKTTATAAQSTANTAKTTATNAQTTANTAKTTANTAKSTANTAKSTAESAKSTADATASNLAANYSTTADTNDAISTAKTDAISTAAEDATAKADTAESNAKAYTEEKVSEVSSYFWHDNDGAHVSNESTIGKDTSNLLLDDSYIAIRKGTRSLAEFTKSALILNGDSSGDASIVNVGNDITKPRSLRLYTGVETSADGTRGCGIVNIVTGLNNYAGDDPTDRCNRRCLIQCDNTSALEGVNNLEAPHTTIHTHDLTIDNNGIHGEGDTDDIVTDKVNVTIKGELNVGNNNFGIYSANGVDSRWMYLGDHYGIVTDSSVSVKADTVSLSGNTVKANNSPILTESDVTSTYSATGTAPVNGTAVASAIPTADIDANTAARHTHANQSVLDGITAAMMRNWNKAFHPYDGGTVTDADDATMGMCTVYCDECANMPVTTHTQFWLWTFFNGSGSGIQLAKRTNQNFILYMRTKNNSVTSAWKSITFA